MIDSLPTYITLTFGLTTIATLLLFIWTIRNSNAEKTRKKSMPILIGLSVWLVIQTILTLKNIYNTDTNSFPPKIMLFGILPTILTILFLFTNQKGRQFIDSLPLKNLTYLNVVRIPVEIVLFWLFLNKAVLLMNIVVNALFSAPSPLQKFAVEQPNTAILNFPFSWLPTFIVPVVLFGHLTSIRQLLKQKTN